MNTRAKLALAAVLIGSSALTLVQSALAVSLPTVFRDMGGYSGYGFSDGCYLLASCATLLFAAGVSDRRGPRVVFASGNILYIAAIVWLSSAHSLWQFFAARLAMGIGAGAIMAAVMGEAARVAGPGNRGRVFAAMGVAQAAVSLLGPLLGGFLTDAWGWRVAMPIVGAASVAALALGFRTLPSGAVTQAPSPTTVRSLLADRGNLVLLGVTAMMSILWFGMGAYLPLLAKAAFGLDAQMRAFVLAPALVGVGLGSMAGGVVATRRWTLPAVWAVALAGLGISLAPSPLTLAVGGAATGLAVGFGMNQLLVVAQAREPEDAGSRAGGLIQLARNFGGAIGVPALGARLYFSSENAADAATAAAARGAYAAMAAVAVAGLIAAVAIRRPRSISLFRKRRP